MIDVLLRNLEELTQSVEGISAVRQLIVDLATSGCLNVSASELEPGMKSAGAYLDNAVGVADVATRWDVVPLSSVGFFTSGNSVDAAGKLDLARNSTGTPYVATKDVGYGWDQINYENGLKILETDERFRRAMPGSVLICLEGGSAGKKMGITDREVCFGNKLIAIKPRDGILAEYLLCIFKSSVFQEDFNERMTGIIGGISRKALLEIQVAIPQLDEQRAILRTLDSLLTLCDQLAQDVIERRAVVTKARTSILSSLAQSDGVQEWKGARKSLLDTWEDLVDEPMGVEDIRQLILELAFSGNLADGDANEEPFESAISRGVPLPAGEKRGRKILRRSSARSDRTMHAPARWSLRTIHELYELNVIVNYADGNHGSNYPRKDEFGPSGVIFVSAKDLAGGRVSWSTCARLGKQRAEKLTKGWAQGGDVLLTHNATVGRVARVEEGVEPFLLGTSVTFYRLNREFLDPSYFYLYLCSRSWQDQLRDVMVQTTRNQVSIQKQADFVVPLPPVLEQRRIATEVLSLLDACNQLEDAVSERIRLGSSLGQSITWWLRHRSLSKIGI